MILTSLAFQARSCTEEKEMTKKRTMKTIFVGVNLQSGKTTKNRANAPIKERSHPAVRKHMQ